MCISVEIFAEARCGCVLLFQFGIGYRSRSFLLPFGLRVIGGRPSAGRVMDPKMKWFLARLAAGPAQSNIYIMIIGGNKWREPTGRRDWRREISVRQKREAHCLDHCPSRVMRLRLLIDSHFSAAVAMRWPAALWLPPLGGLPIVARIENTHHRSRTETETKSKHICKERTRERERGIFICTENRLVDED